MVVRFFPVAAIQFAKARACSIVIGASTRTASRSPEIRVDEIGGHGRCFSPGGRSLVMAGILGAKNTSHFSDIFLVVRPDLELLLSDCPFIERAWPAPIGQGDAVTKAMLRAFDRNSRLEVMMAFSARIFAPFLKQQPTTWLKDQNFGSLYSAEVWSPCYLSSHRSVNTTGTQLYPRSEERRVGKECRS